MTVKDIRERTFEFAIRIARLCCELDKKPGVGRTLSRQLLNAGTSVGANKKRHKLRRANLISLARIPSHLKKRAKPIIGYDF